MLLRSAIAALIVFSFAAASAQDPPNENPAPDREAEQTSNQPEQSPAPVVVEEELSEPEAPTRQDDRSEQRQEEDLTAQRTMAKAAIAQAIVTGVSLLITFVAVYFAGKAYQAADRSAQSARESLYSSRAWLMVGRGPQVKTFESGSQWNDKPFEGVQLEVAIVNFGETPATDIILRADQEIFDSGDHAPPTELTYRHPTTDQGVSAPKAVACTAFAMLTTDEAAGLRDQMKTAFLYFHVSYRDIYRREEIRTSQYCFKIQWEGWQVPKDGGEKIDIWSLAPFGNFTYVT